MLPFAQEIFSLAFKEEPCYSRLKHHLTKVLLVHNVCPDQRFDWSKFKLPRRRFDVSKMTPRDNEKANGDEKQRAKENVESDTNDNDELIEIDSLEPAIKERVLEEIRESRGFGKNKKY